MNILEEFWYGNLDPAEYDASPSQEYKELIRLINRNEEKLLATMTDVRISAMYFISAIFSCFLFYSALLSLYNLYTTDHTLNTLFMS